MRSRFSLPLWVALSALTLASGAARAGQWPRAQRAALLAHVRPARVLADTGGNGLFDNLEAELASARSNALLDVIVRYKPGQEAAAVQIGDRATRVLNTDGSVAARLTAAEIRGLAASGAVESIEKNVLCRATRQSSQEGFGIAKASRDFGLTGDGDGDPGHFSARDHTIAIIDTGIDAAHPDFAGGKILAWRDFVNGRPEPYDDAGHGTHVASIAAGRVIDGVGGVAPGAALVALKVLDARGAGSLDVVAGAVEWCIANRAQYGIEVINLSLSAPGPSDGKDLLSRMVNRAVMAGIVVCVAAGNDGPENYTIGTPGAAEGAITVGNMADPGQGGFYLHPLSSRGPTADGRIKPDLCAPGTAILAAAANTGGYTEKTGTSMAAPFVAGVAALMLQADPTLVPAKLKRLLQETAVHFGPYPFWGTTANNDYGAGRLDGYKALAWTAQMAGTPPDVPAHLYGQGDLEGDFASHSWPLRVDDVRFPVVVSLLLPEASDGVMLEVEDPDGNLIDFSLGLDREQLVGFQPSDPGLYRIRVLSFDYTGLYWLDVSAGVRGPFALELTDAPGPQ